MIHPSAIYHVLRGVGLLAHMCASSARSGKAHSIIQVTRSAYKRRQRVYDDVA